MKKSITAIFALVTLSATLMACKNKAKEAETKDAETIAITKIASEKFTVNTSESTIAWKGFKPTGSHTGTIAIKNGILNIIEGEINSGTFLIDMNSIKDADASAKLEGHLKSADFFDVEKYPTATFEITSIKDVDGKTMLSGNLTLKEVKNNVTFPVSVTNENNTVTLTSESFVIDRTKWNVQYGSKSIFDNLGDKFINDDIELQVTVKASKS
ncbi:YceI family protein [Thalassobellus suaedae]|uniref:YceI family protein n=1 Tax=Thalassobellus suaedae TaxID=3074124 RepID=A0ABY9XP91_9FLAO|nr:YceI family protein [Flavobacteriaceae bacterium HL-DH14]